MNVSDRRASGTSRLFWDWQNTLTCCLVLFVQPAAPNWFIMNSFKYLISISENKYLLAWWAILQQFQGRAVVEMIRVFSQRCFFLSWQKSAKVLSFFLWLILLILLVLIVHIVATFCQIWVLFFVFFAAPRIWTTAPFALVGPQLETKCSTICF